MKPTCDSQHAATRQDSDKVSVLLKETLDKMWSTTRPWASRALSVTSTPTRTFFEEPPVLFLRRWPKRSPTPHTSGSGTGPSCKNHKRFYLWRTRIFYTREKRTAPSTLSRSFSWWSIRMTSTSTSINAELFDSTTSRIQDRKEARHRSGPENTTDTKKDT